MSPLAFGLGSNRAFGIAKPTLKIYDEVAGAIASYSNLSTSASFTKFNTRASIKLPNTQTPNPFISCANVSQSNVLTIEMWKYINVPATNDTIFEIKYLNDNYTYLSYDGTIYTFTSLGATSTGTRNWPNTVDTWRHYVMVLQNSPVKVIGALDGNRGSIINKSTEFSTDTTSLNLRFISSAGSQILSTGFVDEIRISGGDRYNLINNTTYTVPTAAFTVDAYTKHLFRVKSI